MDGPTTASPEIDPHVQTTRGDWHGDTHSYDLSALLRAIRRNLPALSLWLLACWLVAGFEIYRTPPEYTASTQIMLEPSPKKKAVGETEISNPTLDSALADSRIQVIKSERLLRFVFDTLKLGETPDYRAKPPGLLHHLLHWGERQVSDDERTTAAFLQFMGKVGVRRLGLSYVVEISFRDRTPHTAARMANSITTAYIRDLVLSSQHDEEMLQRRIADIKTEEKVLYNAVVNGSIPDQEFPDATARIISAAIEPLSKSSPQTMLILIFATAFGIVTGLGVIVFRHNSDRTIRTRRQILRYCRLSCVASIPAAKPHKRTKTETRKTWPPSIVSWQKEALRPLVGAVLRPDQNRPSLVIGMFSWSKGAGTSSLSYSFASLLGDCNQRVVLVDANAGNPALSRSLTPKEYQGLSDALSLKDPDDCLGYLRSIDRVRFLPWGDGRSLVNSLLLGTWRMKLILERLKDIGSVIIDLPPLSSASEAQAISPLLDGAILVAEAGSTTIDDLAEALFILREQGVALLGIVLNKTEEVRPISREAVRQRFSRVSKMPAPAQQASTISAAE